MKILNTVFISDHYTYRAALTPHSPFLTELDWGMPLLGLFHSLTPSMEKLDDEREVQNVRSIVENFLDERAGVFVKSIEPLLRYGARLTQYTSDLRNICQNFIELSKIKGVQGTPMPDVGRFHSLDQEGMIIGFDGRAVPLGLHAVIPGREKWLLPFSMDYISIVPDENVAEICLAHSKKEMMLVTEMLDHLHKNGSSSDIRESLPIMTHMTKGHAKIVDLLSRDSSDLNLTSCLPPTASMPEAWLDPEAIFS